MSIGKTIAACVLALSALSVQAQDEEALRQAERLGTELFELDRAVLAAEAAGQEWRAFRRDQDVEGWVAERRNDGSHAITFVGTNRDDEPVALYQASVGRSGSLQGEMERLDEVPLSGRMAAQYAARQRAESIERNECSSTYATVVLPGTIQGASGWHAYLLPRAAFPDVHVVGGTYRADMSERGDAVRFMQPLSVGGCTVLQNVADAPALQLADEQASAPNELHVYISRQAGKPLYVQTGASGQTWLIQDGSIRAVSP